MPEFVRVATFQGDANALDTMVKEISSGEGPPPDIPAKGIIVLTDRERSQIRVVVRFGSEEDLRKGSETLEGMSPPPEANMRRTSVETWEVVLERQA